MHILIAEDNEFCLKILHKLLAPYNFTLIITRNGREALNYLTNPLNPRPDIFLLDISMPVMDGKEALKIIRTKKPFIDDPVLQNTPVIVMVASSAFLLPDLYRTWLDWGANDLIPKPIRPSNIRQLLLKWSRRELAPPCHGNMPGPGAGQKAMMRPVWGPMPLRGYRGPRSLL